MYVNAGVRAGRGPPMLRNRRFAQPAKRRFQPVCCVKATPVLRVGAVENADAGAFSIRPETKEGPLCSEMRGQARRRRRKRRTNRCGPHRRFVPWRSVAVHGVGSAASNVGQGLENASRDVGPSRGVLQLSNGDESPEGLRQKEGRESVGGVEERWRIVRGLRTMAQSHGAGAV